MPITTLIQPPFNISNIFRQLQSVDDNLNDNNFSETMHYCIDGLTTSLIIEELIDLNVPFDLTDVQWDFDLRSGARSLARRGFYKIISNPILRDLANVPTWSAYVLYHPYRNYPKLFKFFANIGPLVNQQALGSYVSQSGINTVSGIMGAEKELYLKALIDKTLYISQQTSVQSSYNSRVTAKQTVWFRFT